MTIPNCPKCKTNATVVMNVRAAGWCEKQWYNSNKGFDHNITATHIESEVQTDGLYFKHNKTLRCADCGVIRKDIKLDETGITLVIAQQEQGRSC